MDSRLIWRAFRARHRDQKAELELIRRHITTSDLVCDIGANKGSYLFWLSRWAGQVVAFEPQADLATYLKQSFRSRPNVTIEAKGVFSEVGERSFFIPDDAPANASLAHSRGRKVSIPVVSLDQYFLAETRVSLLKIDVEGAELDVFRGAERVLAESGPTLLFECEARHIRHSVFDVFDHLEKRGYKGSFLNGGQLLPIAEFNPDLHQRSGGDRFWERAGYCNNFLFSRGPA
jgi:FkbM family methyltransferase